MEFIEESFNYLKCKRKGKCWIKGTNIQNKVKERFDKRIKEDTLLLGDMVLRWDAHRDEKGKHWKFDNLWLGPFKIANILGSNTFVLQNLNDEEIAGPVNGRFLKHFYTY